jgi:hypothetical protein
VLALIWPKAWQHQHDPKAETAWPTHDPGAAWAWAHGPCVAGWWWRERQQLIGGRTSILSSPTGPTSSGEPASQGGKGGGSPVPWVSIKATGSTHWWHSSTVSGGGGGRVLIRWAGELLQDLLWLWVEGGGVEDVWQWLSTVTRLVRQTTTRGRAALIVGGGGGVRLWAPIA